MSRDNEKICLELMQNKLLSQKRNTTFFGCSDKERHNLESIILESEKNPNTNDFPDFIFCGGFIEHFQITSAKETKKGSTHTSKEVSCNREFERKVENKTEKLTKLDDEMEIKIEHEIVSHTHGYLLDSMKKNCASHVESFSNYKGANDVGIFMIQYTVNLSQFFGHVFL